MHAPPNLRIATRRAKNEKLSIRTVSETHVGRYYSDFRLSLQAIQLQRQTSRIDSITGVEPSDIGNSPVSRPAKTFVERGFDPLVPVQTHYHRFDSTIA